VANAIIQTPEGARLYNERLLELFHRVYRLERLTDLVNQLHARNRAAVAEIGSSAASDYDDAVRVVRGRILRRWKGVKKQLEAEPGL
jgi:hypothetical protein